MKSPIDEMVDRFLSWPLPENFQPDAGISFKADYNERTAYPAKHKPIGTNLFNAEQAKAMLEFVLGDASLIEAAPALLEAANKVVWFDWSLNDDDAVKAIDDLRAAIKKATD